MAIKIKIKKMKKSNWYVHSADRVFQGTWCRLHHRHRLKPRDVKIPCEDWTVDRGSHLMSRMYVLITFLHFFHFYFYCHFHFHFHFSWMKMCVISLEKLCCEIFFFVLMAVKSFNFSQVILFLKILCVCVCVCSSFIKRSRT